MDGLDGHMHELYTVHVGKYYGCVCSCINMLIAGLPTLTDLS